jgi:hypothetical protein
MKKKDVIRTKYLIFQSYDFLYATRSCCRILRSNHELRRVLLCIFLWCFSLILELFRQCAIFGTVRTVCYFWNCSDSVQFLELFRQCAIFGTVQTVCYFWNCSGSVLFLFCFSFYWLALCTLLLLSSVIYEKRMSSELNILFSKTMTFCMLHVLVVVFWEATMNSLCSSNCITCINKTKNKTKIAHCLNSSKNSTLFIEIAIPSLEMEWSRICELEGFYFASFYDVSL